MGKGGKRKKPSLTTAQGSSNSASDHEEDEPSSGRIAAPAVVSTPQGKRPRSQPLSAGAQRSPAQLLSDQQSAGPIRCVGCEVAARQDGSNWGKIGVNARGKPCPEDGLCGKCNDYVTCMDIPLDEFIASMSSAKSKATVLGYVQELHDGKANPDSVDFEAEEVFEDTIMRSIFEDRLVANFFRAPRKLSMR
jgi:hypothetical protein